MNKLDEIIRECVVAGVEVHLGVEPKSENGMAYIVYGFAKSGTAVLYNVEGGVEVHLRYDGLEYIDTFEDLARICFDWCENYKERGYGYGNWAPVFEKLGWIKKKVITETTWVTT